jgi:general secretion pathway protein D
MHRSRRSAAGLTLTVLAALAVLLGAFIAVPGRTVVADNDEDLVEIILTEALELEDFLKAVGKVAEFPLYWDPKSRALQNKQVIGARNLEAPRDELFNLVRALLTFYELVLIPVGPQGYQVYLVMDARQTAAIVKLKPRYVDLDESNLAEYESQDGLFLTTTIKVENMANLRDARNALNRIVTGQNIGNVTEVPAARSFVVTDFAPNVVAIYRLLKEMDVQPEGKQVKSAYIQLIHATADEIEPILQDLFTGRERITRGPTRGPQGQAASADIEEDPEPRIISDFRTNQLIVYGTQDDIAEIKEVVAKLDVEVHLPNTWVHVYPLKNLDAKDTAEVLQSLIEQSTFFGYGAGGSGRSSGTGRQPASRPGRVGGQSSTARPDEEEKPAVVADVASNSLLISASPRQFDELKRILIDIDVKKPQVLIEAVLLELSLDDSYRVAFELGLADDHGLTNSEGVSGFGFTTFGMTTFADNDGDTYFTDRIPTFVDVGGSAPTGLVGGIFALGQMPLIMNLLNTVSQSRFLQMPSIVAADNEDAIIRVLERQATSQSTTTSGGNVTGGAGDYEDAGITLQISPHIADNYYLLLNIHLTVSLFAGEPRVIGDALLPADQIERELITAVSVPDRHTVVLGGILGQRHTSTIDRTPLLAEIPILGELFKGTTKRAEETSLFLFVTPTIMSEPGGFDVLDVESCKRKQKADALIGSTELYNSYFPACEYQDPATGCLRGSGSASDRLDRLGALERTRFASVSRRRLAAEQAARKAALRPPAQPCPTRR